MFTLAALCVSGAACSRGGDQLLAPTHPYVVVHSVLDPASRDQLVLVELGSNGDFTGVSSFGDRQQPVRGAVVTLVTPDGVLLTATEDRVTNPKTGILGQYSISLDKFGVTLALGQTYTLRVTTSDGSVVTGATTIPNATPAAASPTETFVRNLDTLRLNWPRVANARAYEVRVTTVNNVYTVFADSTIAISGLARTYTGDAIFTTSTVATTTAVVSAVDDNYYEYYRSVADPIAGAPPSHLSGGVGVFGSIVQLRVRRLSVR